MVWWVKTYINWNEKINTIKQKNEKRNVEGARIFLNVDQPKNKLNEDLNIK